MNKFHEPLTSCQEPQRVLTSAPPNRWTVGLLLAAGRGARFDPTGQSSKLLQLIDGKPVVCHAAASLLQVCDSVIAITKPSSAHLDHLLKQAGCAVVECADAHSGMGHSLAWGMAQAQRLYSPGKVVVMLGDMPYVKIATLQALIAACDEQHPIVAPAFMGERGNPWVFGPAYFDLLRACVGDKGAAALIDPTLVYRLNVADPGVLRDIDTPADISSQGSPESASWPAKRITPDPLKAGE